MPPGSIKFVIFIWLKDELLTVVFHLTVHIEKAK